MADTDENSESIVQRMKDKAQEMQSSIAEKLTEVSETGMEKLKDTAGELDELLPLIRDLGYSVDGIQIGVGLVPDAAIEIGGLTKTMDENAYHRILDEQKDKKVLCGVLRALQTASALHHKIHIVGMRSDSATITLGLPPKINLKFKKDVV